MGHNRFKQCINRSGLKNKYLECKILIGYRKGPWRGAAFHNSLTSERDMLLKTDSYEGEVFQTVYPMIVDHWFKGDLPAGVWSDEYKARVFDAFASVEYFHKTGTVDKPSRWYNVPKEMDGIGIALGWVLYATLSMCMELHFYDSIFDTPLYKTGFAPADLPGEDGLPPTRS